MGAMFILAFIGLCAMAWAIGLVCSIGLVLITDRMIEKEEKDDY